MILRRWLGAALLGLWLGFSVAASASIELVSRMEGPPSFIDGPNRGALSPSASADGRYIAFASPSSNLHPEDTNGGNRDVFVFDRETENLELLTPGGNDSSYEPSLSADGRFVAFASRANNLIDVDAGASSNSAVRNIFIHDRATNSTRQLTGGESGDSFQPSISANGLFVAFWSRANDLVNTDENDAEDVFVYDLVANTIQLLTTGANGRSFGGSISGDGRYVAFHSDANNLTAGDLNNRADVFVYDRDSDSLRNLTPEAISGSSNPAISADGRFVAFHSYSNDIAPGDTNSRSDVFVYDQNTDTIELLTAGGNSDSFSPSVSDDGSFISLRTRATNLVSGDTNGSTDDVLVYSRDTRNFELITSGANTGTFASSISADGRFVVFGTNASTLIQGDLNRSPDVLVFDRTSQDYERVPSIELGFAVAGSNGENLEPSVSENGRFVAFQSFASNLVSGDINGGADIFVYDRETQGNELLTPGADAVSGDPSITADGRFVAFESSASNLVAADTNAHTDVFVHDRSSDSVILLTIGGNGNSINPSISADGRYVAFESRASNLVAGDNNGNVSDVFVYDLETGVTELVTAGANDESQTPAISADGRFVAFASEADNLVAVDTSSNIFDIFVYDRLAESMELLTAGGNTSSLEPSISADGRFVAFSSYASNLVSADSNGGVQDIFVRDRSAASTELLMSGANAGSQQPSISGDGGVVTFISDANNLVTGDINGVTDVFVHDRDSGTIEVLTRGADGRSTAASVSGDGRAIAFVSLALNLANDGTIDFRDVFLSVTNDPPIADSLSISTDEDVSVGFSVTGSDPEFDQLAFAVVTQPASGVLTGAAPNFVYTPAADFFGTDSFTFRVNDGAGDSEPATVSIEVASVNDAPLGAGDLSFTTSEDTPFAVTLEGADIDSDVLSYAIVSGPTYGDLFGDEPNLIYSPLNDFNGTDSFTYTVSDGDLVSVVLTINITVLSTNDVPVAVPQSLATSADSPLAITLSGTDVDNTSLSFVIVGFPAGGTLSGALPNLLYTPVGNFVGSDSFTFTVSDGVSTSSVARVSLEVSASIPPPPENNAPLAIPQLISTLQNEPVSIVLSGSDTDGDSLTFDLVSTPANGSLSGAAPDLVYRPDLNYSGSDSFVFTASDAVESSRPVTVVISVVDVNITILAAVLPASRSVEVGTTATAFATLINAGTTDARGCGLLLPDALDADFSFRATDPMTNAVIGPVNAPVDIPAGASRSFVFGITPTQEIAATEVALSFGCSNATDAASFIGLNTLLLSASLVPVPDVIALAATVTGNGVMEFSDGSGFFSAASINVGSAATVTVSADTGDADLPLTLTLCQTDPVTSVCINPTAPSSDPVFVDIAEGGSPTFAVFAAASEPIELAPAVSRVFLKFRDQSGRVRGATSVAVEN